LAAAAGFSEMKHTAGMTWLVASDVDVETVAQADALGLA